MEQYVSGFEVSVEYVLCIECLKGTPNLEEYLDCLLLCQSLFGLDELSQSATITELIDKVVVIRRPQHLNEFDYVRMVYFGKDCYLVVGELGQFGGVFELLYVHHLHCIVLLILLVLTLVHIPVLTLSYLLQQHVVLDHFVHLSFLYLICISEFLN